MDPDAGTTCVLLDHADGVLLNAALETLVLSQALARDSRTSLEVLLLCSDPEPFSALLSGVGAATVHLLTAPELREYDPDSYCAATVPFLKKQRPDFLLLAHTYQNIDFAPKLAARLGSGLVTDCTGYRMENGAVFFVRQMFRNKLNADVQVRSRPPIIATVRGGSTSLDRLQSGSPALLSKPISMGGFTPRRTLLETLQVGKGKVDLGKAEIVVGVGRGIGKRENLGLIQELANVLGAEIGASRPVVDNKWLEWERQIGSSGQSIAPRLYLACGISGAIQHLVGMKNSDCIVAINTDRNAPIFNIAHYGIVGDLFEIVPALIRELKKKAC